MAGSTERPRAVSWLSRDLVCLAGELPRFAAEDTEGFHFDVVIVGSGYGGGMALQALSGYGTDKGRPLRIAMLERGREYLPGAFPSRAAELPGHVRFSVRGQGEVRGRETGLFDLRLGPDMGVVLANGLGGGSLINAGVLAEPLPEVFEDSAWPASIREDASFPGLMDAVKKQLGATAEVPSPRERTAAVDRLGASVPSDVTVAARDNPAEGIRACRLCGDCATGCNFGAKLSVDVGPIAHAVRGHDQDHLRVVTGASVRAFGRRGPGWTLTVEHADRALRRREKAPYEVHARHLVLSAGTLGSTELLMRAMDAGLDVSRQHVGRHFSGNGDNIVMLNGTQQATFAVADEAEAFAQRRHGPTITRTIDLRRARHPMVIQDLGIPGALRRLMEEVAAYGSSMEALAEFDDRRHDPGKPSPRDPEALWNDGIQRSLALAVIVHDAAAGRLVLPRGADPGTLGVDWPEAREAPALDALHEEVEAMAARGHPGATMLVSPAWRPLSRAVERLVGRTRGPLLTVHPLGGCRMAERAEDGVVNHLGQVFRGTGGTSVYANLVVLDGAIVPSSLGINPSLTIAALAQRAACRLRELWGFRRVEAKGVDLGPRPVFRDMPAEQPVVPTRFQLSEQMIADARLAGSGEACSVAIELWSQPFTVDEVVRDDSARVLRIDPKRSRLRVFKSPPALDAKPLPFDPGVPRPRGEGQTRLVEAALEGTMRLFTHEPSGGSRRAWRALVPYILNRGVRDLWQQIAKGDQAPTEASVAERLRAGWNLASRAGDRRAIEYELTIRDPASTDKAVLDAGAWEGGRLALRKVLTYERAANPAVQLMYARLEALPPVPALRVEKKFRVDLPYFGRMGVPLLRIHDQQDHARALIDTASLLAYIGRTILPLHAWTFRLPDAPANNLPAQPRLPKDLPGVGQPTRVVLPLGKDVHALLTCYPRTRRGERETPVLLIHGYSASGTTFAHEALPGGGLAAALCRQGHDAWVLDLRSSSGLDTSTRPWAFEDMGCMDIPAAIAHVHAHYGGRTKVDVVAHCMGAAMLSLGLFGDWRDPAYARYDADRQAMPGRIDRIVFSQVGPAVIMSPANTARAYLAQWLREFLDMGSFAFRPSNPRTAAEGLMDRLLCAVPYPRRDFFRENPLWPCKETPWVAQRHRMDAFFGITFDLQGVSDAVLERIDEFFGPMHLDTVAQTIWFARSGVVTDRNGTQSVVDPERMQRIAHCRVLALHAECNGLVDVKTREALMEMFWPNVTHGESVLLERTGHQDSLIGRKAPDVYRRIADFLG